MKNTYRTPFRMGVAAGVLGFALSSMLLIQSIFRSTNSTAAVGLIFVPFYALGVSMPAFIGGWCLGFLITWGRSPQRKLGTATVVASLFFIGIAGYTIKFFVDGARLKR